MVVSAIAWWNDYSDEEMEVYNESFKRGICPFCNESPEYKRTGTMMGKVIWDKMCSCGKLHHRKLGKMR